MIYDYVIEKPELNENTLAHYGIKGMKWKNHIGRKLSVLDILNSQKTKSLMKLASGKSSYSTNNKKEEEKKEESKENKTKSKSDSSEQPTKEQQARAKEKYDDYMKMKNERLKQKKQIYDYYMNKKKNAFMARIGLRRTK